MNTTVIAQASRNHAIDIAKGIGILLVVVGHNFVLLNQHPLSARGIYLFHMPLFFVLSGMVLSPPSKWSRWLKKRFQALLKPYVVVGIGYALWLTQHLGLAFGSQLIGLAYGIGDTLYLRPMWFLPHLFLATLTTALLLRVLERTPGNPRAAPALLGIGLLMIAPSFMCHESFDGSAWFPDYWKKGGVQVQGLPWSIDLLPLSVGYMLLGYAARSHATSYRTRSTILLLVPAAAVFALALLESNIALNVDDRITIGGMTPLIISLTAIYSVWTLAQRIDTNSKVVSRALSSLGEKSLLILIFHTQAQALTSLLLQRLQAPEAIVITLGLAAGISTPLVIDMLAHKFKFLGAFLLPQTH